LDPISQIKSHLRDREVIQNARYMKLRKRDTRADSERIKQDRSLSAKSGTDWVIAILPWNYNLAILLLDNDRAADDTRRSRKPYEINADHVDVVFVPIDIASASALPVVHDYRRDPIRTRKHFVLRQ